MLTSLDQPTIGLRRQGWKEGSLRKRNAEEIQLTDVASPESLASKQVMEILKKWTPPCHVTFKCPPPPPPMGVGHRLARVIEMLDIE